MLLNYMIASAWEAIAHAKVLHASKKQRQSFKKLGKLGLLMRRAFLSHELIHHRATFKHSFYHQFDTHQQKDKLDNRLKFFLGNDLFHKITHNNYGLTVHYFWEIVIFLAIPVMINLPLVYLASHIYPITPPIYATTFLICTLPLLLSKFIHPFLHQDFSHTTNKSIVHKIILAPIMFLQYYHYLHHTQKYCNFNLCLGADFLFGWAKLKAKPTHRQS